MINLDLFLEELENNYPKKFTTSTKCKKGNILYNIFSNSKTREITLKRQGQTYILWLNNKNPHNIIVSLTELDNIKTVYSLNFTDNRNFSCILRCDTMELNISSKTITKSINRNKHTCEEITMLFKSKNENLSLKYIMDDFLKGTYNELCEDGTRVNIRFNFSLNERRISTGQKMRITTKDKKKYLGTFFIDGFDNKLYIPSFYLKNSIGISNKMNLTNECDDIIKKYIYSHIDDLILLFVSQDAIKEICDLLANPNNLPFEVV